MTNSVTSSSFCDTLNSSSSDRDCPLIDDFVGNNNTRVFALYNHNKVGSSIAHFIVDKNIKLKIVHHDSAVKQGGGGNTDLRKSNWGAWTIQVGAKVVMEIGVLVIGLIIIRLFCDNLGDSRYIRTSLYFF